MRPNLHRTHVILDQRFESIALQSSPTFLNEIEALVAVAEFERYFWYAQIVVVAINVVPCGEQNLAGLHLEHCGIGAGFVQDSRTIG